MFAGLNFFLYILSKRHQRDVNKASSLRTINYRLLAVRKYSSETQEELPSVCVHTMLTNLVMILTQLLCFLPLHTDK